MDSTTAREQALAAAREQALDAAEELFYARGIQTVGMDDIRGASGVSLKRLYQLFPGEGAPGRGVSQATRRALAAAAGEHVDGYEEPGRRILAVFEWLGRWFAEPDFRGCAWINSYGELGATSPRVVAQVRGHKGAFKDYLGGLVTTAGLPGALTDQLFLLAEGAMVTAGITRNTEPAEQAADAARALVEAQRR